MKLRVFAILVTMVFLSTGCNLNIDIGLEKTPTNQDDTFIAATTGVATANSTTPMITASPLIVPSPEMLTSTPSPTPLPGLVVFPLSSLGTNIPWLPLDRTSWPTVFIVTINNQLPPFNNPLVRQAFASAIDKEVIVAMAKRWYAVDPSPATSFIPPQTLGRDLYGEVGINFDPIQAKELLIQAGYTDPSSFPKITFLVNSYGDTAPGARFNMANTMAEMWQTHLGVTVEVQVLGWKAFGERIRSNPPELFWNGWLPDPGNDPDFIRTIFLTGAEYNYGHFSNTDFDALINRAESSQDPATRQALYIEAERLLCETEAGIIPLYHTFSNIP